MAWSLPPLAWLWVACPLVGGPVRPGRSAALRLGGGGGLFAAAPWGLGCVRSSQGASRGRGRGVALPRSVPLPPLNGHQGALRWRRSVHGECGLHTAPAHVLALLSGHGQRGALWGALAYRRAAGGQVGRPAGAAAFRGHCGSGRVMVRGRAARGPTGSQSRAPRPSRGAAGGGGSLGLAGGYRADVS